MPRWIREAVPIMLGVLAGVAVVASAVAALVMFGDFAARRSPARSAGTTVPSTPSATPAESASASMAQASSPQVGLRPGELAPPLEVDRLGGGTINLAALRGQVVWLNFLGSWCPRCRNELLLMEGYWTRLKGQGLAIVGVDVKESPEAAAAFVAQVGVTFPVGVDPTSTTRQYWGTSAMPVHVWIDAEGVVRGFAFGGIGPDQMEAGIRTVLPDATFSTTSP